MNSGLTTVVAVFTESETLRLQTLLIAFTALFLGSATVQAQILPRAIGQWEATASFRALERPNPQTANTVIFRDTPTGATLLDSNTLVDLNVGLGTDIAFSTTREDGLDYEIRFFLSSFERTTLTQADSISSPFFTGLRPREVNGRYTSDLFNIELNQKRLISPYLRIMHGLRYFHVEEELTFDSTGSILLTPFNAKSNTIAKNPMLGYQIGGESRVAIVPGIDVDGYFKCGVYNNFSSQQTVQFIDLLPGSSTVTSGTENELAFVSDFGIRFHLNIVDNFMSMYAGYDGMYVNSFAAAPANVALDSTVVNDLDFWLHGITFGFMITR